jgi:hypothetical protein
LRSAQPAAVLADFEDYLNGFSPRVRWEGNVSDATCAHREHASVLPSERDPSPRHIAPLSAKMNVPQRSSTTTRVLAATYRVAKFTLCGFMHAPSRMEQIRGRHGVLIENSVCASPV